MATIQIMTNNGLKIMSRTFIAGADDCTAKGGSNFSFSKPVDQRDPTLLTNFTEMKAI